MADQTTKCPPHWWVLDEAIGSQPTPGRCKKCSTSRLFKPVAEDEYGFNDVPVNRRGAATKRPRSAAA
jgi:hypothetical protein